MYLDPTGTVFTGYSSPTVIDTNMFVSGSSLLQSTGGGGAGFEILLPANTYALAFSITTLSGDGIPNVELGDHNLNMANYGIVISNAVGRFSFLASSAPRRSVNCS